MIPPPQHHILSNYNVLNLNAHHPLMQNVLNIFNCSIMSYEQKKKKQSRNSRIMYAFFYQLSLMHFSIAHFVIMRQQQLPLP